MISMRSAPKTGNSTYLKGGVPWILLANSRIYPRGLTGAIGKHSGFCCHVRLCHGEVTENGFQQKAIQTLLLKNWRAPI